MVVRIGRGRRKTRSKLKKNNSKKGKLSIRNYFQKFKEGDKVQLLAEPAVQKGFYHPRFYGKHGKVASKQGNSYLVSIKDIDKVKKIVVHPVHLKSIK